MAFDLWDAVVLVGLLLCGVAVYLLGDWAWLLGYLGLLLTTIGVLGARARRAPGGPVN